MLKLTSRWLSTSDCSCLEYISAKFSLSLLPRPSSCRVSPGEAFVALLVALVSGFAATSPFSATCWRASSTLGCWAGTRGAGLLLAAGAAPCLALALAFAAAFAAMGPPTLAANRSAGQTSSSSASSSSSSSGTSTWAVAPSLCDGAACAWRRPGKSCCKVAIISAGAGAVGLATACFLRCSSASAKTDCRTCFLVASPCSANGPVPLCSSVRSVMFVSSYPWAFKTPWRPTCLHTPLTFLPFQVSSTTFVSSSCPSSFGSQCSSMTNSISGPSNLTPDLVSLCSVVPACFEAALSIRIFGLSFFWEMNSFTLAKNSLCAAALSRICW